MYEKKGGGTLHTHILPLQDNIVRVTHSRREEPPPPGIFLCDGFAPAPAAVSLCQRQADGSLVFSNGGEAVLWELSCSLEEKTVYEYVIDGEPVVRYKQTANGEVSYIENARRVPSGTAYAGRLTFGATQDEHLYGLGQHEDGVYNYNGQTQYLYQNNMKIALPFLLSSRNYGILLDSETAMVYRSAEGRFSFDLDTVDHLSYYVLVGGSFDEIIGSLRALTGAAAMLPRWAFGYVQSAEHYHTAQELADTARRFRRDGIPLDCIVQDWATWPKEQWGNKTPEKERYPNLPAMVGALHKEHIKLMVSVWPNMAPGGGDYAEFADRGLLLAGAPVYNAFEEEARALYWRQCESAWFSAGTDAFWCDNTEPFSDADWSGAQKRPEALRYRLVLEESRKAMDWRRLNTYGLLHARGMYENWRRSGSEKRVVNLTRSTYISGQRYGAVAWSGDTSANWATLKNQITEGIQFSLCGMPYWTLDIGGFFVVKDKWENRGCGKAGDDTPLWFWNGDYNDGTGDLAYRELYVRWFQLGAFLPMFRSHGTDTRREPWNFGEPGGMFYDTLLKYIRLRYRLLPYMYSCAAAVARQGATLMRSLMFDFADDENCAGISGSFLFGSALLVCPVTQPMYYGPGSVPISGSPKTWDVYLPGGCGWVDYWTRRFYEGGQTVTCEAPLDILPLFVRAGSILPLSADVAYADERGGEAGELAVYAGADGRFTLYNDEGDTYSYENGNFSAIPLAYDDGKRSLTFGAAQGAYPYQRRFSVRLIEGGGAERVVEAGYNGEETTVFF